jgi:hypothetical protein
MNNAQLWFVFFSLIGAYLGGIATAAIYETDKEKEREYKQWEKFQKAFKE